MGGVPQIQQQREAQREGQQGLAKAAALGGLAEKLRIAQVMQVAGFGHAADGANQLGAAQGQQRPAQQYRQAQPDGAALQQQEQAGADGQVG